MKNRKKVVKQEKPEKTLAKDDKFFKYFGFCPSDLKSFKKLTLLLYRPTDASSLCVVRMLFGNLIIRKTYLVSINIILICPQDF